MFGNNVIIQDDNNAIFYDPSDKKHKPAEQFLLDGILDKNHKVVIVIL